MRSIREHPKLPIYRRLVAARKVCARCTSTNFLNAGSPALSQWDSDQIGPWSRWLGDLDARLLIVGQEWGDTRAFETQNGCDLDSSVTNKNLRKLLEGIGMPVPPATTPSFTAGVFLTNAALCLKRGGCQAPVDPAWFRNCGKSFLRPLIELIQPKVVATLGLHAYRGVMHAYGRPPEALRGAVDGPPQQLQPGTLLVPLYHCGARIMNTHRPQGEQLKDWSRLADVLTS